MLKRLRSARLLIAVAVGLSLPAIGRTQAAQDPEAALKEINTWYAEQVKLARDNKTQLDFAKLLAERKAKIQAALKDASPERTEPAKCLALAQLYQGAQQQKEAVACIQKYLTSNPAAAPKYTAQQILLAGYESLGDVNGVIGTLGEMRPATPQMAALLASNTARLYALTVSDKLGLQAGLDLIDKMERQVPFDQLKTDPEKRLGESAVTALATGRSALYEKAGKKREATAALEAAVKKLGPDSPYASSIVSKLILAKLPGSTAPELVMDRHYGDFKDLASLRGKVVVLDFTAHW